MFENQLFELMADGEGAEGGTTPPAGDGGTETPPANGDGGQSTTIPKARFDEVIAEREKARKEAADLQKRLAKLDADKAQAEQKALEDQGNWKAIAEKNAAELEKYKPLQERLTALETQIKASNDKRIALIPESMRKALVPMLDKLSPDEVAAWLDEHGETLQKPAAPDLNAGAKGDRKKAGAVDLSKLPKAKF